MSKRRTVASPPASAPPSQALLDDLRRLIAEAKRAAAVAVNVSLTMLYWRVGHRIRGEVLGQARAGYGEEIVATLSRQLVLEHGARFYREKLAPHGAVCRGFSR